MKGFLLFIRDLRLPRVSWLVVTPRYGLFGRYVRHFVLSEPLTDGRRFAFQRMEGLQTPREQYGYLKPFGIALQMALEQMTDVVASFEFAGKELFVYVYDAATMDESLYSALHRASGKTSLALSVEKLDARPTLAFS